MIRIRTIKPRIFRHEVMQNLEREHWKLKPMLVFIALWGHCDKAGRFKWNPRALKLDILPFLKFEMADTLALLERTGFVQRYEIDGVPYGLVPTFGEHQRFSGREAAAEPEYPAPLPGSIAEFRNASAGSTRKGREGESEREGEGNLEGKGARAREGATRWLPDAIVPDDWITDAEQARIKNGLPKINLRLEAEKFANYWTSASGRNAAKLDWKRTWLNWALADDKRNAGRTVSSSHPFGILGEIGDSLRESADRTEGQVQPPHRR
jgi:hypothetical protein